jgi:NAD(P)-dependent dehydrogenase (short-subunit alcohol dehydrogenase family)
MKAVVLGGTSGMGRAIAQILVERGDSVFLLGIPEGDLARSAADLSVRSANKQSVGYTLLDLEKPEGFAAALEASDTALGGFDTVIVTAALFASQEALEDDVELCRRLVTVNYANTVVFCEHARKRLLARGGGRPTVFSSVAGDRGRKPVAIYGSSKGGLSIYLEALDHNFYAAGLRVLCLKRGLVKTAMTAGLKPPPFAGEPEQVAKLVVRSMDSGKPLVYAPRIWWLILFVIKMLPRFVMRKINF